MQGDGNFVVYDGGAVKWSTGTTGTGANRLVMQSDGNLVLYAGNTPKWTSTTAGTGTGRLVLQDDGNLVLYENDRATWSWRDGYLGSDLRIVNTLRPGGALMSANHRFGAVMQSDGNFVVYEQGVAKWSTGTTGSGANRLVMQGDGHLVLYAGNTPKWSSNTAGTGTGRLVMQNDGNLVLYENDRATWSWRDGYLGGDLRAVNTLRPGITLWSPNHRFGAVMQGDGNFVVYEQGVAKWSTGTGGTGANRLVMQGDGNLVLYAGNTSKWATNTAGTGSTRLAMQDDGNLVLYSASGPTWSSNAVGDVLTRAQSWVDARVSYSQQAYYSNQYGRYRTDCSGYVSMAWGLGTSLTTGTLPSVATRINKDDLRAGDILNSHSANRDFQHVVLFDQWADAGHTKYWGYEQAISPGYTVRRIIPYPYDAKFDDGNYLPYRRNG
jgi:hypothetical protein